MWILLTFYCSALIFPLAILFGRLFRVNFMADRTAVSEVIFPAMGSMLLFWPMAITAFWGYPEVGAAGSLVSACRSCGGGCRMELRAHSVVQLPRCGAGDSVFLCCGPGGRRRDLPRCRWRYRRFIWRQVVVLIAVSSKSRQPALVEECDEQIVAPVLSRC